MPRSFITRCRFRERIIKQMGVNQRFNFTFTTALFDLVVVSDDKDKSLFSFTLVYPSDDCMFFLLKWRRSKERDMIIFAQWLNKLLKDLFLSFYTLFY